MNATDRRNRHKVAALAAIVLLVVAAVMALYSQKLDDQSEWKSIVAGLGSFLASTVLVGFVYEVFVREHDDARYERLLRKVLDEKLDTAFAASAYYGLEGFVSKIDFADIFDSLESANTLWWLDTYDPHHKAWHKNLEAAVRRGAHVRFLVMNPNSPLVDMRAVELGANYAPPVFQNELAAFLVSITRCKSNTVGCTGSIHITLYDDLPCAPIYIVVEADEPVRAYSSMFLGLATGVHFPHMKWRLGDGEYIVEMFRYVQSKWQRHNNGKVPDPSAFKREGPV